MLGSGHAVALYLLALQPSDPAGTSGSSIAVASIVQTAGSRGGVDDARLNGALAEGLGRGSLEIGTLDGDCQDRPCWIDLAREGGRTHVILPTLEQRGPDHLIRLEVIDVTSGAVTITTDEVCEICGEDEVIDTVANAAAELIPRLERLEAEPPRLVISGRPTGATVQIDGEEVGVLPWQGEVDAGEHILEISHEGYAPQTLTITASSGVQEQVEMELRRTGMESRPRVVVASSLVAAGVVGMGTGAGLLAIHGRPYRRDCAPEQVDINGRCPRMYESRASAIALMSVGGAVLVAGVALLVHTLRRRDRTSPEVGVRPTGRGVTFAVRF